MTYFLYLGPVFDFAIYAKHVCLLFILYPELHHKALLEVGRKEATQCFGDESYALSGPKESFEEQSFILILKIFQRPKWFSRKSVVDLILHVGFKKL